MKKQLLGLGVAGAVIASAGYLSATQASAHFGNNQGNGANYSQERHDQMEQIIADKDYDAWLALVGDRPVTQYITRENFSTFLEMMSLRHQGKFDEADALRAQLGLPERGTHRGEGDGNGNGMGKGRGAMMGQGQGLNR